MDELQYRDTYRHVNPRRCHFEKSINARVNHCRHMQRFNLADREGVRCNDATACARCADWLHQLRHAGRFALATSDPDTLPHRLEAKVQSGGLHGLAALLGSKAAPPDVATLLDAAVQRYGELEQIPLDEIIEAIARFEPRRKKPRARSAP